MTSINNFFRGISIGMFLVAFCLSIICWHNIDNAWNMNYVETITGLDLVENTVSGNQFEADELYIKSSYFLIVSLFTMLISLIFLII